MDNQASEDELREQLADKLEWYSRYRERGQDDDMDRAFDDILVLIRTEKLKLLAEVRERVVQSLPDTAFHGTSIRVKEKIRDGGYHDGVLDSRLATEETLTKLEALYGKDEK